MSAKRVVVRAAGFGSARTSSLGERESSGVRFTDIRKGGNKLQNKIKQFQEKLESSQKIVFFGGAGVSTASGIPDFRSATGLFMQDTGRNYSAEDIISHSFFNRFPEEFFSFYFEKLIFPDVKPNLAHNYLVELEKMGKEVTVVTQNIDGLHQLAGSQKVLELHGTVLENYCLDCYREYSVNELVRDEKGIPRCPQDGGVVRPNIVLYEEGLNQDTIEQAISALEAADMLIVAGTSLVVYPAAGLVNYFRGEHFVVINQTPLQIHQANALVFENTLNEVFTPMSGQ